MKIIYILFIFIILGCDNDKIVTDPSVILPIYKEAIKCCDGYKCENSYLDISQEASCTDVTQFESCLKGIEEECPLKGYGAF